VKEDSVKEDSVKEDSVKEDSVKVALELDRRHKYKSSLILISN
jgi:hypothetical protein